MALIIYWQRGCGPEGSAVVHDGGFAGVPLPWLATTGITAAGIAATTATIRMVALLICAAFVAARVKLPPLLVSVVALVSRDCGACTTAGGAELSPVRKVVIWPGFSTTHCPARLHTFTNPSNTITFITLFWYST